MRGGLQTGCLLLWTLAVGLHQPLQASFALIFAAVNHALDAPLVSITQRLRLPPPGQEAPLCLLLLFTWPPVSRLPKLWLRAWFVRLGRGQPTWHRVRPGQCGAGAELVEHGVRRQAPEPAATGLWPLAWEPTEGQLKLLLELAFRAQPEARCRDGPCKAILLREL